MTNKFSEEKMEKLLYAVNLDLTKSKLFFSYFKSLNQSFKKYPKVVGKAYKFWTNAKEAFFTAMKTCLMRVYDQNHKDAAIGLRLLLLRVKENLELFSNESCQRRLSENFNANLLLRDRVDEVKFIKQLDEDINKVTNQHDVVKRLVILRNNNGAHRSEKVLYGEDMKVSQTAITYDEIENLINDGLTILNFYSYHYNATSNAGNAVNYEDHNEQFLILQKYYENIEIS